ncbi:MAG: hypothetical protein KZQ58_13130, partial [gamma proteobacterium symbiont of Bathyaustriella thionipta]|nr:hypothetical protein [gamma proteobacterium symbiont of Bathyaustriella thionipta]
MALTLYRADGHNEQPSVPDLVNKEYMSQPILVTDMQLAADGSVRSAGWGSPADMPTLLERPVKQASSSEKQAYERYLSNYNRFWRRYFDPIALRLNQQNAQQMEISTFILPLIDNSIYQGLKQILAVDHAAGDLLVPELQPEPIVQLSLNLNNALWKSGSQLAESFLVKFIGVPPRIMDFFASDLHLALGDGDPIIIMGSGGLSGMAGMLDGGNNSGEMFTFSMLGSLLTRPSVLLIGLNDAPAVKNILNGLATGPSQKSRVAGIASGTLFGIAGKDAWRYELNLEGLLSLRFGLEVKGRFLAITNQPLGYDPQLQSTRKVSNSGAALSLSPAAAVRQRPALFASASEQQRKAAMSGINVLYPLMLAGAGSVEEARQQIKVQLGFEPKHPGRGHWQWHNHVLSSSVFGTVDKQTLPQYKADDELFGIRNYSAYFIKNSSSLSKCWQLPYKYQRQCF